MAAVRLGDELAGYPDWILARGFGGIETAASPVAATSGHPWPEGKLAPMAVEACNALLASINDAAAVPTLVFLVGGAGNGKSKIAADLVKGLGSPALEPQEAFARRIYTYPAVAGRKLRVVNDATIPPKAKSELPALTADIVACLQGGEHMLACVNRGVLVTEVRLHDSGVGGAEGDMASCLLSWILAGDDGKAGSFGSEGWRVIPTPLDKAHHYAHHYRFARIEKDNAAKAFVHVVYMDQASLLEPWPSPSAVAGPASAALHVQKLDVSPVLGRKHGQADSAAFIEPLTKAVASFLAGIGMDPPGGGLDPIAANATALSKPIAASAWCAMMRGAEVVSGTHFSYRELWALTSHSLLGMPKGEGSAELASWVKKAAKAVADTGLAEDVRLGWLIALAGLRTHVALFGGSHLAPDLGKVKRPPVVHATSDALQALSSADPLFNFGPTVGSDYRDLAREVESIAEGKLPSHAIRQRDPSALAAWTDFDEALEKAVCDFVKPDHVLAEDLGPGSPELKQRNAVIGWYGQYMFRLVGFSRGWCGHVSVVDNWQQSLRRAIQRIGLPDELNKAIRGVILMNQGNSQTSALFALLKSRLEELGPDQHHVSVQVPLGDFALRTEAIGDQVIISVRLGTEEAARTVLDFHLVREAMARSGGHGFTDSLRLVEPRLERLRAGLLAAELKRATESGDRRALLFKYETQFSA